MEYEWVQHLIRVIGLFLGALGATVVLAADWSTVESYLVKIGNTDPLLHYIPVIGYPFIQAKKLADMLRVSEKLFNNEQKISINRDGFVHIKRLSIEEIDNEESNSYLSGAGMLQNSDFVRMELDRSIDRAGSIVEEGAYTIFYDEYDDRCGWIWTSRLRNKILNRVDDIISKTGASLFIGGFLLQILAELILIPDYPEIQIPHIVFGVFSLSVVLSIPALCGRQ